MDAGAEGILAEVEERGIGFVRLWFADVLGFAKSFAVPAAELEKGFREGIPFDGSAIEGFARLEEADVLAHPDPATFRVLPGPGGGARMFCDVRYPDGAAFDGDPRQVLRRVVERAAADGFRLEVSPEVEFFLSGSASRFEPLDRGGYFDLAPAPVAEAVRREAAEALAASGIAVTQSHHEDAPSQHEFDLGWSDALSTADDILTLRLLVKQVAQGSGLHASFMPKPAPGIQGSGMHVHLRLLEGERNAMYDATAEARLSKVGRAFVAGLLAHAGAITAVTNQWVNSYKRLVPGFEAPAYVCWGRRAPSALVRVPADRPDDETSARVEYRAPDPACNPYLALAVILAAGLDGIRQEMEPPAEVVEDLGSMSPEERRAAGIATLPEDLHDAVAAMERSELVAETLGEHVFEWFIRNKREEWQAYRGYVTPFEIERSFPLL